MDQPYSWARRGGYEISSNGDKRFSAFSAKIKRFDNLTIEVLYQCTNHGKGNDPLVFELAERAGGAGYVLTDCFANTPINQARALSELLNEFFGL